MPKNHEFFWENDWRGSLVRLIVVDIAVGKRKPFYFSAHVVLLGLGFFVDFWSITSEPSTP